MTRLTCVLVYAACSVPLFAQGGFNGPGAYVITNLDSGKVMDLDQGSVIQSAASAAPSQIWEIQAASEGFYYLRNAANGCALDAGRGSRSETASCAGFNGGPSQQWRLEPGKDGNLLIVSRLGRTMDVPDGTSRDGARLQVYDRNGDSNQRFILRSAPGNWRSGRQGSWRDRIFNRDQPGAAGNTITCASNSGDRVWCDADTRNGVSLVRQISGSPCRQGETWGWDDRGIWVDRGCRAEFTVNQSSGGRFGRFGGAARTITCSSNNGERVWCDADTRGQRVQMIRQISGSACREGSTWGVDNRGIWVDRGCRAEFSIR